MMRQPLRNKRPQQNEISSSTTMAAPIGGWNTRDPLANMQAKYAIQLDNWLPDAGTLAVRPGAVNWVTAVPAIAKTLLPWNGPTSSKLFAATNSGIYEVTSTGVAGASVLARTQGYHNYVNFTTTGGQFVVLVNGTDDLAYYNGTVWSTVVSFTVSGGGTLLGNAISNISSFKRSLYFIKKNSMSFFYLPIDSITGTVSEFPLGGLFSKGGKLVASATWTIDGGVGMDDFSVFISDKGQMAIYQGTDPSSATTWALKGMYDVAPPLGEKCFCRFGGDLLVLTNRGLFSMTQILRDTKAVESSALSDAIGEAFTQAALALPNAKGWEVIEHPEWNVLVCNIPLTEHTFSNQYVMNTKTKAWCRFKGWDGFTFALSAGKLYMGMANKVAQVFKPGNDFDASITCEAKGAFNYYSPRSRIKSWRMVRPNLTITGTAAVNVALDTDFGDDAQYGAAVFSIGSISRWDVPKWNEGEWSTLPVPRVEWLTVAAPDSYCAAIRLRAIARDATITWSASDTLYEVGALV